LAVKSTNRIIVAGLLSRISYGVAKIPTADSVLSTSVGTEIGNGQQNTEIGQHELFLDNFLVISMLVNGNRPYVSLEPR